MAFDPWRYRCPNCESVCVRKRRQLRQAKEVVGTTNMATRNTTDKKWYCENCKQPLKRVLDAKFDQEVVST